KNIAQKTLAQFKKYSYLCGAKVGCTRHNPNKFGFCSHLHDLCNLKHTPMMKHKINISSDMSTSHK
ncbi:MAG: hypothetical protein MJZ93_06970, partial [Paludibacteraceae bacterium]|nr:hypothetical protein [Paludibacteraceae bacterium]